jgi:hypothetical protein
MAVVGLLAGETTLLGSLLERVDAIHVNGIPVIIPWMTNTHCDHAFLGVDHSPWMSIESQLCK